MLADMLLELKRPSEAIAEYRTVLKNSPNRFDGLLVPRAPHKQPATRVVLNRITPNWRKSVRGRRSSRTSRSKNLSRPEIGKDVR